MKIGVLALQGNYAQHQKMCEHLRAFVKLIRYPDDLQGCEGLIIPGGESTTISKIIEKNNFRTPIVNFSKSFNIFGTCAGMILLSATRPSKNIIPLNILKIQVNRNAWGSQIDSFSSDIELSFNKRKKFHSIFIRSPRIKSFDKNIQVLATYNNEPILLTNGKHLISSFHPEIGTDIRIHKYFFNLINERRNILKKN